MKWVVLLLLTAAEMATHCNSRLQGSVKLQREPESLGGEGQKGLMSGEHSAFPSMGTHGVRPVQTT
jgi:hypothetical protein